MEGHLERSVGSSDPLTSRLFENPGSLAGGYAVAATAMFNGAVESLEHQNRALSQNSMLQTSIEPLDGTNSDQRARLNLEPVGSISDAKLLPGILPHVMQDAGTQQSLHKQTPSDLLLRLAAVNPNNAMLSMLLQGSTHNSVNDQARLHLMGKPWDLEPTPIRFQQVHASSSADQHTAAVARQLFHEGSLSSQH
jgi:hypothetical protein